MPPKVIVKRKGAIDAAEQPIGQKADVKMSVTGAAVLEHPIQEVEPSRADPDKIKNLAFMEEFITVEVSTTTDPQAPVIVETWNDGRCQRFIRGVPVTVKRKFVEVLARSKPINYRNLEYTDPSGSLAVRWPSTTGLAYPFRVVEDANPKGPEWLRKVLSDPA